MTKQDLENAIVMKREIESLETEICIIDGGSYNRGEQVHISVFNESSILVPKECVNSIVSILRNRISERLDELKQEFEQL